MKSIGYLNFYILFFSFSYAQSKGINYQRVARDSVGHPVIIQNISFRLSILEGSATGTAVYVETQNTITNVSGLFNVCIGMGSVVSGVFANVPWGTYQTFPNKQVFQTLKLHYFALL